MIIRQGDVLLVPTTKASRFKSSKGFIMAYGEATGHHHKLEGSVGVLDLDGERFIQVLEETLLTHQEHGNLVIPPDTYKIVREREYNYFLEETQKVVD